MATTKLIFEIGPGNQKTVKVESTDEEVSGVDCVHIDTECPDCPRVTVTFKIEEGQLITRGPEA